jgi:hypothetical protein
LLRKFLLKLATVFLEKSLWVGFLLYVYFLLLHFFFLRLEFFGFLCHFFIIRLLVGLESGFVHGHDSVVKQEVSITDFFFLGRSLSLIIVHCEIFPLFLSSVSFIWDITRIKVFDICIIKFIPPFILLYIRFLTILNVGIIMALVSYSKMNHNTLKFVFEILLWVIITVRFLIFFLLFFSQSLLSEIFQINSHREFTHIV